MNALFIAFAGLLGAAGVAGAAAAAHGGDARLSAAGAAIALVHAPSLLSLAGLRRAAPRILSFAGLLMILGALFFCGDLLLRAEFGSRLFPYSAPIGGSLLIVAWLAVFVAGLVVLANSRR